MKITAGLGSVDDYELLVMAGADEVFCGFVPFAWNDRFGSLLPLNRREVMYYHVQINAWEDMKLLARMRDIYRVPVTVTLNALYYTQEQLVWIADMVCRLLELGFEDYIIADIGLLMYLEEQQIPCHIHMSGELGEWNTDTIELLKSPLLKRIIFHRKNTIEDMQSMTAHNPEMEYEAFAMNELCHFTGGFCNSLHCDEMVHICQLPYHLAPVEAKGNSGSVPAEEWQEEEQECIGDTGCGLCALWKLQKAGVTHLKIVGRGRSPWAMADDIRGVKEALRILEQSHNEQEYCRNMKKSIFDAGCSHNCYYR